MATGSPRQLSLPASTLSRAGRIWSPASSPSRSTQSGPYLLQELQDTAALPGQALGLLRALQPDLGSLGIQGSHPLLGSGSRDELAAAEPWDAAWPTGTAPWSSPCHAHLPAGDAAVALGPALQQLLPSCLTLLFQVALSLQLLELQVLKQLGLRLQCLCLL